MLDFSYHSPTKVVFGNDAWKHAAGLIQDAGLKRVLVHFGTSSARANGLLDMIEASLESHGITVVQFGGVEPNPKVSLVRKAIDIAKVHAIDCILAVGGGSVVDSAKAIGMGIANTRDPWEMIQNRVLPTRAFPLGVVLTHAAAGSEMSHSVVLTDADTHLKRSINHDLLRPVFACMDPALSCTVPRYPTACGIVDIMMHTLERYHTADRGSEMTDRIAEGVLVSVRRAGDAVMANLQDIVARGTLMWASSLSHNNLTGCGRMPFFPVHKIEHDVSGLHDDVAHGAGLAVLYPAWARYVYQHDVMRFAQSAVRVWDVPMDFEHPERTALEGIEVMQRWFVSLGMPATLAELGVLPEEHSTLADMTTASGHIALQSYLPLGRKEIMEILAIADQRWFKQSG